MGLFKKIKDLARANLNDILDKMEDPKKLAKQYMLDMQEQKNKAQELLINTMAAIKVAELRLKNYQQAINDILDEVNIYLQNNQEEKAKEALAKKQLLSEELNQFAEAINQEKHYADNLKKGITNLELKISQQNQENNLNASKAYLTNETSFDTFARMEEKISHSEAEINALNDLIHQGLHKEDKLTIIPHAPFDYHSDPSAIEKELLALKNKLKH